MSSLPASRGSASEHSERGSGGTASVRSESQNSQRSVRPGFEVQMTREIDKMSGEELEFALSRAWHKKKQIQAARQAAFEDNFSKSTRRLIERKAIADANDKGIHGESLLTLLVQQFQKCKSDTLVEAEQENTRRKEVIVDLLNLIPLCSKDTLNRPPCDSETGHLSPSLKGWPPLHMLAQNGLKDGLPIMTKLLEYDADVEKRNDNGLTPILVAAGSNFLQGMQLLRKYGADIHATRVIDGKPTNDGIHTLSSSKQVQKWFQQAKAESWSKNKTNKEEWYPRTWDWPHWRSRWPHDWQGGSCWVPKVVSGPSCM